MAIFGNLSEFPFLEVIKMLERKSGVLRFLQLSPYGVLELHLQQGVLQALIVDGVSVKDTHKAHAYLLEIAGNRVGEFEFGNSRHTVPDPLDIRVARALTQAAPPANLPRELLPDVKTRFLTTNFDSSQADAELKHYWPLIHPLLMRGSSAEEIARQVGLREEVVQLALYRLRTIGAIRPARRIEETQTAHVSSLPVAGTAVSNSAALGRPRPEVTPLAQPSAAAAKPTLLSRLLGALAFVRRTP